MTPAERAYRIALRAYPASYRRERGLEILTTILDGGDERWPPRGRELVAIVLDGVARRGQLAGGGSRAGSIRAGVRLGAFGFLWILAAVVTSGILVTYVGPASGGFHPSARQSLYQGLLVVLPLLALVRGWWRAPLAVYAGAIGLQALGFPNDGSWPWDDSDPWRAWAGWALFFAPSVACALARPRAGEPDDARSPLWVPAAVVVGALAAWQSLYLSSWLGRPVAVAFVMALLLARRDPRLAAAAAFCAALAAAQRLLFGPYALVWLGVGSRVAPLLLALTVALVWRLRPQAAV